MDKDKNIINKIQDNARKMEILMGIILIVVVTLISCKMPAIIDNNETKNEKNTETQKTKNGKIIIVDPGHGGVDPGKIGINGDKEKDINLQIGLKLKEELIARGYKVIMTREVDEGMYANDDSNKKRADMRNRCELINSLSEKQESVINISVHQNSFPSEQICGPQVFYYAKSEKGRQLAKILQNHINTDLQIVKPRVEKKDDSYYMLVHTNCPSVIVECGFLSNYNESRMLVNKEYQQKLVRSICDGVDEYYK